MNGGINKCPKCYKYNLGEVLKVNEKAKYGMPNTVHKTGKVIHLLDVSQYDYEILLEDNSTGRFKECELDRINLIE
ncbi:YorP family protein [Metabacillus fastidiosus]|uniref:YorP family protein n=1 Tax=Metabacillus fastidiosus TaxID=1458 RepID=UPI003D2D81FE